MPRFFHVLVVQCEKLQGFRMLKHRQDSSSLELPFGLVWNRGIHPQKCNFDDDDDDDDEDYYCYYYSYS